MLSSFAMFLVLLAIGSFPVDSLRQDENETRSEVFQIQKPSMMGVSFLDGSLHSVRINNHSNQSRNNSRESPLRSMTGQVVSYPTAEERAQIKLYILQQIREKIPDLHRELSRQEREALADEILEALFPTVSGNASASREQDAEDEPNIRALYPGGFEALKTSRAKKKQEFVKAVLKEHPHVAALIAQDSLAAHEFTAWVEKAFNEDDDHWRRQAAQQTSQVASQPAKARQRTSSSSRSPPIGRTKAVVKNKYMAILVDKALDFDKTSYLYLKVADAQPRSKQVDASFPNAVPGAIIQYYLLALEQPDHLGFLGQLLQVPDTLIAIAGGIGSLERAEKACNPAGAQDRFFIPMPQVEPNDFKSLGWPLITPANSGEWYDKAVKAKNPDDIVEVKTWTVKIERNGQEIGTRTMYFHMSTGYDARTLAYHAVDLKNGNWVMGRAAGRWLRAGFQNYNIGLKVSYKGEDGNWGSIVDGDVSSKNVLAILNSPIMHGNPIKTAATASLSHATLQLVGWNSGFRKLNNGEKHLDTAQEVFMEFGDGRSNSYPNLWFIQIDGVPLIDSLAPASDPYSFKDAFAVRITKSEHPVRMMEYK